MSKKSPIKGRILSYLEYRGISENEFYRESKVSRRVLKQSTGLSEDNLHRFLTYDLETNHSQRVNLNWLIRGEGQMMEPYTYNQDKSLLDPGPEYGHTSKEESYDAIMAHLAKMSESYSSGLKEVAQAIKRIKED